MNLGQPLSELPWIRRLVDLEDARSEQTPEVGRQAFAATGKRLGDELRSGPTVQAVRTLDLTTLVYPAPYAFDHSLAVPLPYVGLSHRCLYVELNTEDGLKRVLFNPTDFVASEATPYFADMLARLPSKRLARKLLAKQGGQVDEQLRALGVQPESIDVIAFDHFHTQDLRPLLGTAEIAARFPNAYLLAPKVAWRDWDALHPMQQPWFVARGKDGLSMERVVLTEDDLYLGEGCVLLQTPGHTRGNQSLFVHGERGVFGVSENGCCADNWSPEASRLPGVRRSAARRGLDVIMNVNTPELASQQYNAMILERSIVCPAEDGAPFVQMFSSSEVSPTWVAPGIRPTWSMGERDSGTLAA
ncbi:MAG: hypothetical protein AAF411_12500 [Myxococcota bacterium]